MSRPKLPRSGLVQPALETGAKGRRGSLADVSWPSEWEGLPDANRRCLMQHPTRVSSSSPSSSRCGAGPGKNPFRMSAVLDHRNDGSSRGKRRSAGRLVGPQGALISNDEVASFVCQHPDRLSGLASVNLARPMDAVRELRRCVRELGFRGLRMCRGSGACRPTTVATTPCTPSASNSTCLLSPGGTHGPPHVVGDGTAHSLSRARRPRVPELRIVAGHIGAPWTQEIISLATKFPNLFVDTSPTRPGATRGLR